MAIQPFLLLALSLSLALALVLPLSPFLANLAPLKVVKAPQRKIVRKRTRFFNPNWEKLCGKCPLMRKQSQLSKNQSKIQIRSIGARLLKLSSWIQSPLSKSISHPTSTSSPNPFWLCSKLTLSKYNSWAISWVFSCNGTLRSQVLRFHLNISLSKWGTPCLLRLDLPTKNFLPLESLSTSSLIRFKSLPATSGTRAKLSVLSSISCSAPWLHSWIHTT